MEFIFGFILFTLAVYVSFYLPGKLLLSHIYNFLSDGQITFLSFPVGLGIFFIVNYVFLWLRVPALYLFFLAGIIVYALIKNRSLFTLKFGKIDFWSLGILFIGSLAFFSLTAFSFFKTNNGIQFVGSINVIDGLLHIGYTKNLLSTFPPTHAGLADVPLRGYHYFYDLLLSRFVLFFYFTPQDLYYRYFSLFISLLYGGGFYFLTSKITKNIATHRFVLFFAYFSQSFAFLLSFFVHSISPSAELGSIYPLELILNPAIVLSIGMLLSFIFLLFETKPKILNLLLIGFLFGIITELKVYTGIIGIITFSFVIFYRVILKRHKVFPYLLGLCVMLFIVGITYIPNNLGAGNLWFSPLFAYSVYMQGPPFNSWNWELQRIIFRDHHNIPHLVFLYMEAVGFFWILSLGSRIILLLGISSLFKSSFWKEEKYIALLVLILSPILIGSFFVQSVSIFDTKQFFWIAGALISIPAGAVVGNIIGKKYILGVLITVLLIVLSWGGVVGQLTNFVFAPKPHFIRSLDEKFLLSLEKSIPPHLFFVYLPTPNLGISNYPFSNAPTIAALTGHATYFEPESAQFDIKPIYAERKKNLAALQTAVGDCNKKNILHILYRIGSHIVITTQKNECLVKISSSVKSSTNGVTFYTITK